MAEKTNLLPLDGWAYLEEGLFALDEAEAFRERLESEIDWHQEYASFFGKRQKLPRLTAWFGDGAYAYSGVNHPAKAMPLVVRAIHDIVERRANHHFNSVLLNLYRDGADGMGWHSDDEVVLGPEPVIASISFGAVRRFSFKHKKRATPRIDLDLPSGSCLLMGGSCQAHWRHQLPKTKKPVGPRINLTYRWLEPDG
ncbi:MAG: alpha-ketoglutarate-dependent dioxygenase AlkB [Geminicoccaceae bacterium]